MKGIILFLSFNTLSVFAQMLDNTLGQVFEDKPFFNRNFIAKNHIHTIKGYYSSKAELDIIRPNDDVYLYEFDLAGRLIREFKTAFTDTIIIMYEYDHKSNLILKRQSDQNGFHAYHYKYDEKGRVVEEEYRRDSNKSNNKLNFELEESFIITTERYEYLDFSDSTHKKVYFNNAGREYRHEFFYADSDGYLLRQEARLKNGSGRWNTTYEYDEKGRIKSKIAEVVLTKSNLSEWTYEYDEFGNLLSLKFYRNKQWITEYQIIYDSNTLLLKAIITRDHATNFMMILQFKELTFF